MDLYEAINRRKSVRRYTKQPLSDNQLAEIRTAIDGFAPLYPDVPLSYRFVAETKGLFNAHAPQYLIISGQGRQGEAESAGFLFQQLVLWLDAKGLGSVWLGKAADANGNPGGNDFITIALGTADEPVHRTQGEFKRKPIGEITNVPQDACIQAVHLAPSGMNLQPWYLEKAGDKVLVYIQQLKPPTSLLYKKTEVDMGIALCHYMVACQHLGKPFRFTRGGSAPEKSGYRLFGEIM